MFAVSRASESLVAAAAVSLLLIVVAFWVAPRACEGGFETYLQCGIAALIVLAALPFALRRDNSLSVRIASALGFVVLGIAAWIAGVFVANVNFLCRLF
jgi:hypothetical protein